jgi:hypothetical protein
LRVRALGTSERSHDQRAPRLRRLPKRLLFPDRRTLLPL